MKRSQPKRYWDEARAKVEAEGMCRLGGECAGKLEAAHVTGREHDQAVRHRPTAGFRPDTTIRVDPISIIPLCTHHHSAYDAHAVDILHVLTVPEQVRAVQDLGGIENARIRTCPSQYKKAAA